MSVLQAKEHKALSLETVIQGEVIERPFPKCGQVHKFSNYVEFKFMQSPWPFWVKSDVVDALGGLEPAFNFFCQSMAKNLLPRNSSKNRPYNKFDLDLGRKNIAIGKRHWQYRDRLIKGNTSYRGYGYTTESGQFQIVDLETGKPWELI